MAGMAGMTDTDLEDFLSAQPLGYHNDDIQYNSDLWEGVTLVESQPSAQHTPVHAECWDDIEHVYTELHKSIDWVISKIPLYAPPRLDQVKEQNRKLIAKLKSLDGVITRDTTPAAVMNEADFLMYSSAGSESATVASGPFVPGVDGDLPMPEAVLDSCTPPIQDAPPENVVHRTPSPWPRRTSFAAAKDGSKLAKKLLQVGNQEARLQVAEFASQSQLSACSVELPRISRFPSTPKLTDGPHFLQLVTNLGLAIESSMFGEQSSRIRKRIALAHFYHAYTLAQDNPKVFLSWCDRQQVQGCSMLPKGGSKSVVQHRFADLILSRDVQLGGTPMPYPSDNGEDAKRRAAKIQMWRKSGKKWAQFTQRFGYGILLLLPSSLSDEDLRIASDEVVGYGLDLVDSRKRLFSDILQQANDLLEAHFFLSDRNSQQTNTQSPRRLESENWDELLETPGRSVLLPGLSTTPGVGRYSPSSVSDSSSR